MLEDIIRTADTAMMKTLEAYEKYLSRLRTGRASVNLLEGVAVEYYGATTPINQVASLSTPDARTIVISPFEKHLIKEIERAILMANINLTPSSDGQVIRISVPPLTQERRQEIAKSLKKSAEDYRVALRSARKTANDSIKKCQKNKDIGQDESKKWQKDVQNLTNKYIQNIDTLTAKKEQSILSL